MKNVTKIALLALMLSTSGFATADHHAHTDDHATQLKHVGFSEMGEPATVLEVTSEASRALRLSLYSLCRKRYGASWMCCTAGPSLELGLARGSKEFS